MGVVHDIVWDEQGGEPTAVLLSLCKKTTTTDGYNGPSFFTDDEADELEIPKENAIVAITWHTKELNAN